MSGNLSDYLEQALLNVTLRGVAYTAPSTVYLALYTVTPSDSGGGIEVSTSSTAYARQAVTFSAPTVSGSAYQVTNSGVVTFPQATADWGTVVAVGIFDASTAGNLLWWMPMTTNKTVNNTDTIKFNASQITLSLD